MFKRNNIYKPGIARGLHSRLSYLSNYCLFDLKNKSGLWNWCPSSVKCPSATQGAWEWWWWGSEVRWDRKCPIGWIPLACSCQLEKCLSWWPGASELMRLTATITSYWPQDFLPSSKLDQVFSAFRHVPNRGLGLGSLAAGGLGITVVFLY